MNRKLVEFLVACLVLGLMTVLFSFMDVEHWFRDQLQVAKPNVKLGVYSGFFPSKYKHRDIPVNASYRESFPETYTGECASNSSYWKTCDAPICVVNTTSVSSQLLIKRTLGEPRTTRWGQRTADYVQEVMKRAWGDDPPMIDLYVRAGCRGAYELSLLYRTVALFWPAHLGDLIIVLDWNDKPHAEYLVNRQVLQSFSIHVVFEHQPCMPGRLFNQYSYLNLYRHSTAEFVVTIDSDCAFHRPVTPDVLFNSKGELILPTSQTFQSENAWHGPQQFFTQIDERKWGHSMVSQPVAFKVDSFPMFFDYIQSKRGTCYESIMSDYITERRGKSVVYYCWMCQLAAYVAHFNMTGYDVYITNLRSKTPYLRYASHVSYEKYVMKDGTQASYIGSVKRSTLQGLCFWFGNRVFAECSSGVSAAAYVKQLFFRYAYFDLASASTERDKQAQIANARARLFEKTNF